MSTHLSSAPDLLIGARGLRSKLRELAAAVCDELFRRVPALDQRYGEDGRARCLEDNEFHLGYLADAVAADSVEVFRDYVTWAKILFAHLEIPASNLLRNLEIMRDVLAERLAGSGQRALAILSWTIEAFDELPDTIDTFLDPDRPHAGLARRYIDSLLAGDRRTASRLIMQALDDGVTIPDLYIDVFEVCQHEVGRLWQTGEISVAHEHFCTAATQMIMSQLYPHVFTERRSGRVLVACCVEEDLHELGVRMVCDLFEMEGWDTYYLGANTPTPDVIKALKEHRADALAISVTIAANLHRLVETIVAVRSDPEIAEVRILAGGLPFRSDPELWKKVGADGTAHDAPQAVQVAARLSRERADGKAARRSEGLSSLGFARDAGDAAYANPEAALLTNMAKLNNELVNARRELTKRNRELARLNDQKNQFLGVAAHDLRNPLGVVSASARLLPILGPLAEPQRELLTRIEGTASFMLHMVEDLLDVSSIESGKLVLATEKVDLAEFAREQVASNRLLAGAKEIAIELEIDAAAPGDVIIDVARMTQVINNLLSNAVKYSERGTTVTLRIHGDRTMTALSVVDQGQGIPAEEIDGLFAPFHRTSVQATEGEKSTGLGLSIANKVVKTHGGYIDVASELGVGSTFTVYLPTSRSARDA